MKGWADDSYICPAIQKHPDLTEGDMTSSNHHTFFALDVYENRVIGKD